MVKRSLLVSQLHSKDCPKPAISLEYPAEHLNCSKDARACLGLSGRSSFSVSFAITPDAERLGQPNLSPVRNSASQYYSSYGFLAVCWSNPCSSPPEISQRVWFHAEGLPGLFPHAAPFPRLDEPTFGFVTRFGCASLREALADDVWL